MKRLLAEKGESSQENDEFGIEIKVGLVNLEDEGYDEDQRLHGDHQSQLRHQLSRNPPGEAVQLGFDKQRLEYEIIEKWNYFNDDLIWRKSKDRTRRMVWIIAGTDEKVELISALDYARPEAVVGTKIIWRDQERRSRYRGVSRAEESFTSRCSDRLSCT